MLILWGYSGVDDVRSVGISPEKLNGEENTSKEAMAKCGKNLNKKRSYVQYHLELGQSDFLLHTCSICGFKYAAGDDGDEKVHKAFHKNYTHGIQFKGWRNERVIDMPSLQGRRIILVFDDDPPAQKNKVQEVVKIMEMEIGDGWIFHKQCKVQNLSENGSSDGVAISNTKESRLISNTLQFGGVQFQREIVKRVCLDKSSKYLDEKFNGAILCENEAVAALCGIRAIWVSPSNRRKHIATHLLDAASNAYKEAHESCASGNYLCLVNLFLSVPYE
ncbi:hypothetical protein LguiA_024366 [Lonicera macranthoides]